MGSDSLLGTTLGEYQVVRLLGQGGMGEVYEGLQPVIGKRVAIKVLTGAAAASPEAAERFLREARAVNSIGHRGIVDIFSFGRLPDGRGYFVMPLLQGEPLDEYLKAHAPLAPTEVVSLLDELLEALGAAHEKGIIHRDIKPSNVFLAQPPNGSRYVMLLDFGIAKQLARDSNLTNANAVLGTPHFMAPEQARGQVSARSDLYAVGCLAWTMLTKRYPFSGSNSMELINHHLNTPPSSPRLFNPGVPLALEALVLRLMAKRPEDRLSSAVEVRRELKRLRRSVPELSPGTGPATSLAPAAPETATPGLGLLPGELPTGSDALTRSAPRTPLEPGDARARDRSGPMIDRRPEAETPSEPGDSGARSPSGTMIDPPAVTDLQPVVFAAPPTTESDLAERLAVRRPRGALLAIGAAIAAAIIVGAVAWREGEPVAARPVVPPSLVLAPALIAPSPSPAAGRPATPQPAVPSRPQLAQRIVTLEQRQRLRKPQGDRLASLLLDDAREQLKSAKDEGELAAVARFLDGWEQRFGSR